MKMSGCCETKTDLTGFTNHSTAVVQIPFTEVSSKAHTTFPLSLTPEEKEQYKNFCHIHGDTMSGRIKELMRKDMANTVLSGYKDKYQHDIIAKCLQGRNVIIVKSRQMFITTLMMSIMLELMIKHGGGFVFTCVRSEAIKSMMDKFEKLCIDNGINARREHRDTIRLQSADAQVAFRSGMWIGADPKCIYFLDECAYNNDTVRQAVELAATGTRIIMASSVKAKSEFNQLAYKSFTEQTRFEPVLAHWSMNPAYVNNGVTNIIRVDPKDPGKLSFHTMPSGHYLDLMMQRTYEEEMDCVIRI
jgi:hypothetical protein